MAIAKYVLRYSLLGALFLSRSAAADDAPYFPTITHTPALLALCRTSETDRACAGAIEAHQLRLPANRVARVGSELRIPLARGGTRTLADPAPDTPPDDQIYYRYIERVPELAAHVCFVEFYEGSGFVLAPEDGSDLIPLDAAPLFAPSRGFFATLSAGTYEPTRIQIYAIEKSRPVLVWTHEPKDWGPGRAKWLLSSVLEVATDGLASELPVPPATPRKIRVLRRPGGWVIEPPPRKS